jgi:hypothetical protein
MQSTVFHRSWLPATLFLAFSCIFVQSIFAQKNASAKPALMLTKQDSAVIRATSVGFNRVVIGRRVIVNASFSSNSYNNPQASPILACKIGDMPEEYMLLDQRFEFNGNLSFTLAS